MIDIMRSAGHLDGVRPWHIRHYRADVPGPGCRALSPCGRRMGNRSGKVLDRVDPDRDRDHP